jgi:tRNA-splicing endonuclease subunit Sen54
MGHSVQRPSSSSSSSAAPGKSLKKRLELLPEEALYLVERGALFCWKATCEDCPSEDVIDWDSTSQGTPMSVQQAYAEMIGTEDLTLGRYQVSLQALFLSSLFLTTFDPTSRRLSLTFVVWVTS